MSEYSHSLGDAVKQARKKLGLTQRQVADMIDVDERTIMNIETYRANTTMEVLYPLIRTLHIDARSIFHPEEVNESPFHYQLRELIDSCSEEEAKILLSVCQTIMAALHEKEAPRLDERKRAYVPI